MTKLLETALAAVLRQPPAMQDEVAQVMLRLVKVEVPEPVEPMHRDAVIEGLAQLRRGEYASDEEVEAAFRSFG
jgi:predicted transcriptional regulator